MSLFEQQNKGAGMAGYTGHRLSRPEEDYIPPKQEKSGHIPGKTFLQIGSSSPTNKNGNSHLL